MFELLFILVVYIPCFPSADYAIRQSSHDSNLSILCRLKLVSAGSDRRQLTGSQWQRLQKGVTKAGEKDPPTVARITTVLCPVLRASLPYNRQTFNASLHHPANAKYKASAIQRTYLRITKAEIAFYRTLSRNRRIFFLAGIRLRLMRQLRGRPKTARLPLWLWQQEVTVDCSDVYRCSSCLFRREDWQVG